ncbi:hypothetical protein [Aliiroseovarius sp. M344]|nr:hypothetical protein [Aliiroseovarius sp. M344]
MKRLSMFAFFASPVGGGTFVSLSNPETGKSRLDVLGSVSLQ